MFSRPEGLTDLDVVRGLERGWGLEGIGVEYVPLGFGSYHWKATHGDDRWFATADDLAACRQDETEPAHQAGARLAAALDGARTLRRAGLDFVVAPVPQRSGELLRPVGADHLLALYPFVDGPQSAWGSFPDAASREAVVRRLAVLHGVPPERCPGVLTDGFALPHRAGLAGALADLGGRWDTGPYAEPARELLRRHASALRDALPAYDRLAAEDPDVLDLYGGLTGHRPDPVRMALYRVRWDLTEVCLFVDQLRRPHVGSADTAEAWDGLQTHLDPARWGSALLDR